MRLIFLTIIVCQAISLVNAQDRQHDFTDLLKVIFNEKSIDFRGLNISELGNPEIIILKNQPIKDLFNKDFLIKEISEDSPRAFILDDDYIFGYKVKFFLEFTEIKIGSKKATLEVKVNEADQTKRLIYSFKKKKGNWFLSSVK
ncbi:MAG: hypothetical protein O9311_08055 [Cytophagales bacterium]|nr:hypothetical protein [Cytophagales bacterium]